VVPLSALAKPGVLQPIPDVLEDVVTTTLRNKDWLFGIVSFPVPAPYLIVVGFMLVVGIAVAGYDGLNVRQRLQAHPFEATVLRSSLTDETGQFAVDIATPPEVDRQLGQDAKALDDKVVPRCNSPDQSAMLCLTVTLDRDMVQGDLVALRYYVGENKHTVFVEAGRWREPASVSWLVFAALGCFVLAKRTSAAESGRLRDR
jgi:hypothetical protein